MNIKKKILAISIGPVLVLGIISLAFSVTMVKNSMLDEVKDALKGTAAATLAAYDQNTGDYMETSNGDIWKGSYNISKSESLVDRIKSNSGMDVTFFYGDKRIMTSAVDGNGDRVLNSKAGDKIVEKVLKGGEEYFSRAVSIEGTLNYGYFMPVYQNGSTDEIIGMVFVGTDKQEKDMVINQIIWSLSAAVFAVMIVCMIVGMKFASSLMCVNRRNWQSYIMWQIFMILCSFVPIILYLTGIIYVPYLALAALGTSVFLFLGTLIIGDRRARVELKRRFHIR